MEINGQKISERERQYFHNMKQADKSKRIPITYDLAREWVMYFIDQQIKEDEQNPKARYDFTKENIIHWTNLTKYFINDPTCNLDLTKGIGIFGEYGVGKSFFFKVFQKFASKIQNKQFSIFHCAEFVTEIGYKQNAIELNKYTLHAACFDDLMKEPKLKSMGMNIDSLDYILTKRERNQIPTHTTFNGTPDNLRTTYGEHIESRCYSLFNWIFLDGKKDYRKCKV
jgi:DNA replication protein DnaC